MRKLLTCYMSITHCVMILTLTDFGEYNFLRDYFKYGAILHQKHQRNFTEF